MLRIKKVNEVIGKQVYTSEGDFFGQIEDANLVENRIEGWKIKLGSSFINSLGGARGVIIPHQYVKAIGDIFVVNSSAFKSGGMPSSTGNAGSIAAETEDLI